MVQVKVMYVLSACNPADLKWDQNYSSPNHTPLWWPFCVFSPRENGKHMLNWVRCGGGCGGLAQNTMMLVARQECLRRATLASRTWIPQFFSLYGQTAPDWYSEYFHKQESKSYQKLKLWFSFSISSGWYKLSAICLKKKTQVQFWEKFIQMSE